MQEGAWTAHRDIAKREKDLCCVLDHKIQFCMCIQQRKDLNWWKLHECN